VGVATHLGIDLGEYDVRIRTFIPDYEEMLDVAAAAVPRGAGTIVDLGTGTGALARRCLAHARAARIVGIDADREILDAAAKRLGGRASFIAGSFLRAPIPSCDAIVASFALHHVRTRHAKARLYRRMQSALRRNGVVIVVDCHPSADRKLRTAQFDAWRLHLDRTYPRRESIGFLRAWAHEDVYVPLDAELMLMRRSGFRADVLWRKDAFAVLAGRRG
jgi:SAM-dependent methyltransferase